MPVSSLPTVVGSQHVYGQMPAPSSSRGKGLHQAFYFVEHFRLDLRKQYLLTEFSPYPMGDFLLKASQSQVLSILF